ncbi:MAG: Ku protein [Bdellovibrionales bacterium GWA2_49_15]|nr:MAG: Ku protein [Bdellovibrionales bacterium GWA2_49_15]HAZ14094.1 Ku protein [Bdellovibrionales bacterium]
MRANIWRGALSFGLLNIPVRLAKAEEEKNLHFSMLDEKNLAPIKYKKINAITGKEVPYDRIVKGYEYKKNEYVVMTESDFKAANVEATGTIDIGSFVNQEEVDLMYVEKPYYLVPEKNAEKGYFLLCEAMKKSKKVALAKIVMTTKQHLALIMVRGDFLVLELLRFAHEVLDTNEVEYFNAIKKAKFTAKELAMAMQLISDMTEKWNPVHYKDTYYDDLKNIIDKKIKSGKGKVVQEYELPKAAKATNIIDLMPLLKASLEKKKKKRA